MVDCVNGSCPIDPCPCPHFETCLKRKQLEAVAGLIDKGEVPETDLLSSSDLVKKAYELVTELEELRKAIKEMNEKNVTNR